MSEDRHTEANLNRIEEEVRRFWQLYGTPAEVRSARRDGTPFRLVQEPLEIAGGSLDEQVRLMAVADVFARVRAMQGAAVTHQITWAAHGLPVELEVEQVLSGARQRLGSSEVWPSAHFHKPERLSAACSRFAAEAIRDGEALADRIGVWLNADSSLSTAAPAAISAVWSGFGRLWEGGRVREMRAIVPVCPRCATPLSEAEADSRLQQAAGRAIGVRLPWDGEPDTYLLTWTETPWMLVGMVAVAAHPTAEYVIAEWVGGAEAAPTRLVVAESALERTLGHDYRVLRRLTGKALRSVSYRPLFTFQPAGPGTGRVILSELTPLQQGSGLWAVTPAYEPVSLQIADMNDLPVCSLLNDWGGFDEAVTPWRGISPCDADALVVQDLRARGLLTHERPLERQQRLCPYCTSALLPLARQVWQLETEEGPWTIGRERIWGTPIPIWACANCGRRTCVGGLDDLAHRVGLPVEQIDLHRPAIDRLILSCPSCGKGMERTPAVLDTRLEQALLAHAWASRAGVVDLVIGRDEPGGWLEAFQVVSRLLGGAAYAKQTTRLSSSPRPAPAIGSEGPDRGKSSSSLSDALRWAAYTGLTSDQAEETFIRPLWRLGLQWSAVPPSGPAPSAGPIRGSVSQGEELLSRWLRARLVQATRTMTEALREAQVRRAALELAAVLQAIAGWCAPYLPGPRLLELGVLTRLAAPFVPHIAEAIHRQMGGRVPESIHLGRWPVPDPSWEDDAVVDQVACIQRLAELGKAARVHGGIDPGRRLSQALVATPGGGGTAAGARVPDESVLLEYARMALGVEEIRFVEDTPEGVTWHLSVDPNYLSARDVPPEEIDRALTRLPPAASWHLVRQLWQGFSVSVEVQGRPLTLLPGEVVISLRTEAGWVAAAEPGRLVALRWGALSGEA